MTCLPHGSGDAATADMFQPKPQRGPFHRPLLHRLERAAAGLNPTLMLIVIGLIILNLLVLLSLIERHGIARAAAGSTSCITKTAPPANAVAPATRN